MSDPQEKTVLLMFRRECVCTSKTKSGKTTTAAGLEFLEVTQAEIDSGVLPSTGGREMVYSKKGMSVGSTPGMIYRFKCGEKPGQIFHTSGQYVGKWPNAETRLRFEVENNAFKAERDRKSREENETKNTEMKNLLDPLRDQYQSLPYSMRPGFLASVIYHVTH